MKRLILSLVLCLSLFCGNVFATTIFPEGLSPNWKIVQADKGQTVESVIADCTEVTEDNPYVVEVPPGVHNVTAKIQLPEFVDLIGQGRARSQLKDSDNNITECMIEINHDNTTVKNLHLRGDRWDETIDLLTIKNSKKTIIENMKLELVDGSALVFDHPANLVSKCTYIRNLNIEKTWQSAVINKGMGYARVFIDGVVFTTNSNYPDAHGIEGNFLGSMKNMWSGLVGGDHIHITDSLHGLSITDCHFEGNMSTRSIYLANCKNIHIKRVTFFSRPHMINAIRLINCQNCVIESCGGDLDTAGDSLVAIYADADSKNNVFKNNWFEGLSGNKKLYDISAGNKIEGNGEEITAGTSDLQHWSYSELNSSGGAIAGTLPDGTWIGQRKTIVMTDATASSTVSCTHHVTSHPEIATFEAVGETWILEWTGAKWVTVYATCTFSHHGDPCEGDFDNDGNVDGSDFAVFVTDFGRTDCP